MRSPAPKKRIDLEALEKAPLVEFLILFQPVELNQTAHAEDSESQRRESSMLREHSDGSMSMILDYRELQAYDGRVSSFEKLVRLRLNFFL